MRKVNGVAHSSLPVKLSEYTKFIPNCPHCMGRRGALLVRKVETAITFPLIQPNFPEKRRWMLFDMDYPDSWLRLEGSGLPLPNYTAVNPANGHAHIAYLLASPVSLFEDSSEKARGFFRAIERAFCRRLDADRGFSGFLTKNPHHPGWIVDWNGNHGYELSELNDVLDPQEKRWYPRPADAVEGFGRNDTLFRQLREFAYRAVLIHKKESKSQEGFLEILTGYAMAENLLFSPPLYPAEVRQVVKSVAKWVWPRFTLEKFRALQSKRVSIRWKRSATLIGTPGSRPWEAEGVSRATWYRQQRASS